MANQDSKRFNCKWRMTITGVIDIVSPDEEKAKAHLIQLLGGGVSISVGLHSDIPIQIDAKVIVDDPSKSKLVVPQKGKIVKTDGRQ